MVRRHQRQPRPRQLQLHHLDLSLVVDVIEMQHREDARIRPAPPQVLRAGRCSAAVSLSIDVASPRIHSLKSPSTIFGAADAPVVHDRAQPSRPGAAVRGTRCRGARCRGAACRRPMAMSTRWQQRGSHVFHDRSYCVWWRIGKRLSTTLPNREPRRCRVGAITQPMPSSAPISSACPCEVGSGADHLLQGDDVGVDDCG